MEKMKRFGWDKLMRANLPSPKIIVKEPLVQENDSAMQEKAGVLGKKASACTLQFKKRAVCAQSTFPSEIKVKILVGWKRREEFKFWSEWSLCSLQNCMCDSPRLCQGGVKANILQKKMELKWNEKTCHTPRQQDDMQPENIEP